MTLLSTNPPIMSILIHSTMVGSQQTNPRDIQDLNKLKPHHLLIWPLHWWQLSLPISFPSHQPLPSILLLQPHYVNQNLQSCLHSWNWSLKTACWPISPIPSWSAELHACLADFSKTEDVDLLHSEVALAVLDLTPGIISDVPVPCLIEVTGALEGHLWKLQAFFQSWTTHLADKKLLVQWSYKNFIYSSLASLSHIYYFASFTLHWLSTIHHFNFYLQVAIINNPTLCIFNHDCKGCLLNELWPYFRLDSLSLMLFEPGFDWQKGLFNGIEIQRVRWEVDQFGIFACQVSWQLHILRTEHTALHLNDLVDCFIMMYSTIVQDYYTLWTWKRC